MRIITYNVNGVRAAIRKGMIDWLKEEEFDIICIQETKAQPEQVDLDEMRDAGYEVFWHSAEKKGYSGTLTMTKKAPKKVKRGIDKDVYFKEGRVLRTDFDDFTLFNCYFPSGTTGDVRQEVKMSFLTDFKNHIEEFKKQQPNIIVAGDYNIAHTPNDIHNPKRNKNTSGFLAEERAWMTEWFESGFTDTFRSQYPDKTQYSWWSYRARSRERNKGWRIDYQSVADKLADSINDAYQLTEVVHSDHCPVYLDIEL